VRKLITYTWLADNFNYEELLSKIVFDELVILIPQYAKYPHTFMEAIRKNENIRVYECAHLGMGCVLNNRADVFMRNYKGYELKKDLLPRNPRSK
jgi:hypothetical protein